MDEQRWDERSDDPLLGRIMVILEHDVPDPNRRRAVAMILQAHIRADFTKSLRAVFDPWIGMDPVLPEPVEAAQAMRDAVIRIAGFDRDDPMWWDSPRTDGKARQR